MSDNIIPPEDLNIEKIFQNAFRTMVDQIVAFIVNTMLVVVSCVFLAITVIGILAIPAVIGGYVESMIRMARGEKVNYESSGLSKREWNELMTSFDFKDFLV